MTQRGRSLLSCTETTGCTIPCSVFTSGLEAAYRIRCFGQPCTRACSVSVLDRMFTILSELTQYWVQVRDGAQPADVHTTLIRRPSRAFRACRVRPVKYGTDVHTTSIRRPRLVTSPDSRSVESPTVVCPRRPCNVDTTSKSKSLFSSPSLQNKL